MRHRRHIRRTHICTELLITLAALGAIVLVALC